MPVVHVTDHNKDLPETSKQIDKNQTTAYEFSKSEPKMEEPAHQPMPKFDKIV